MTWKLAAESGSGARVALICTSESVWPVTTAAGTPGVDRTAASTCSAAAASAMT